MEKTFVGIRDVDKETFRKFRAMSIQRKMKLGDALKEAMSLMLKEKTQDYKNNLQGLLEIKPVDFGKGNEKLSMEIDKILYGDKK